VAGEALPSCRASAAAKEVKQALEGLEAGTVDIVVGTHKLLSPDVKFKRLGLLVIDEEHRFGVRHKEAIKAMRAEVDVLTLTATPIPRTLGMALEGLRDLSVIATAPQRRLAIKTFVRIRRQQRDPRGGAARIEARRPGLLPAQRREPRSRPARTSWPSCCPRPASPWPTARCPSASWNRDARLHRPAPQPAAVLTIIETGIDVPSANTIVISRADKFGLAQLHQLRGRVGRSHHQAYAYLLVPDTETLTKQAQQRLDAIQSMEELGSGFYLAMHDLEIRGAGEVLGEHQSGNMMEVGFQLYNDMLAEAVRALKMGQEPDLLSPTGVFGGTTEINLHAPALLPDAYCGDVQVRLNLYKRLATADKPEQLDVLLEEMTDRFGKLPAQGQTLFDTHRLRVLAKPYGVAKIDANPKLMNITFRPNPPIDAMKIIALVQKNRTSSWPATTSCASSARWPTPRTGRSTCAMCCGPWGRRWRPRSSSGRRWRRQHGGWPRRVSRRQAGRAPRPAGPSPGHTPTRWRRTPAARPAPWPRSRTASRRSGRC
jgi:transcription-repair coupling factor (superfamily II helicase)